MGDKSKNEKLREELAKVKKSNKELTDTNADLKKRDKTITKGMSNKEILEKATITTNDIAAAGRLNDAQADRFIDFVIDVTGLKDRVRVVRFRNDKLDIDKINVGNRVALAKAEAKDPSVRRRINTSKVTLQPEFVMVPWEVSDDFVLENIEGDNIEDTIGFYIMKGIMYESQEIKKIEW